MSAIGGDNVDLQLPIIKFPTVEESDTFPVNAIAQQESPGRGGECSLVSTPLNRVGNGDQVVTNGNAHSERPPSERSIMHPRGTDIYRPDEEQVRRLESQLPNDREFAATMMDDDGSKDRPHVVTYRYTLDPCACSLGWKSNPKLVAVEGNRDREGTLRESCGHPQVPIPRPRPSTLKEKDRTAGVDKFRRERDRGDGKTRSIPNHN